MQQEPIKSQNHPNVSQTPVRFMSQWQNSLSLRINQKFQPKKSYFKPALSWMRSGFVLRQFLRIFLPTLSSDRNEKLSSVH